MTNAGELLHRLTGEVAAADQRIRPWVRETPLDYSPSLSKASRQRSNTPRNQSGR